nr:leukocyte immunoglobulin-like receptor subfamily A member 6 [Caretta caretta]
MMREGDLRPGCRIQVPWDLVPNDLSSSPGCWLAGQIGISGPFLWSRPSISVCPSGVIAPGAVVTIHCQCWCWGRRLFLDKDGIEIWDLSADGDEFTIPSARREHGGSYTCRYSHTTGSAAYSEPSDPVQIIVTDPSLPRPSISLSPTGVTAPGADVTIRCRGQPRDVRFFLHKAGDLNPPRHMDPAGDGAEFHIPTVGRQHGGSYGCSYQPRSEPFVSSQPSHPVQLVVAGPALLTSHIIPGVSAAAAVLLLLPLLVAFVCFRKTRARKGAAPRPSSTSPMGALKTSAQQGPVYASINKGKEPQTLEPDPGADEVTYAELDGQALQAKRGALAPAPEPAQPSMYAAINVSQGALQCRLLLWGPSTMGPSPALLLALGVIWTRLPFAAAQSPYSKPSISLSPSGEIAPGTDVSISCHGPRQGMRFKMYRAGVARWHMEPAGLTAEFHIPNVRREDGGTYTCSYESLGEPPVSSPRSDPVELVVAVHFSKPSISLSPSGEIAPGTDVSISCHGPRLGMRFKMYRAGVARWHTEPAGLRAEFHIPNVRREDGGTYTCSYESLGEPPVSSPHSDPVELVVADAGSGPTGGSDLTQPGVAPAPTRPGSTRPGAPPSQDYTPFAIVRLSLAVGVLLALVLILAEAAYSWKRTPHPLTPPRPSREQSRQPKGQTETLVLDLQPPQIPARSLGTGTAGHTHQGGRVGAIGPTGPSSLVSTPHSPPPPPPLPPQIRSMGPSTLLLQAEQKTP